MIVKLTEQDLHNIINESVKSILKEYGEGKKSQKQLGRLYMRKSLNAKSDKDIDDLGYIMKYSMDKQDASGNKEKMRKSFQKGVDKEMDRHFKGY